MGRRRVHSLRTAVAVLLAAIIGGAQAVRAQSISRPDRHRRKNPVVRIVAISLDTNFGEGAKPFPGSGFVIAPGEVLTDHHVVAGSAGATEVKVYIPSPSATAAGGRCRRRCCQDWPPADLAFRFLARESRGSSSDRDLGHSRPRTQRSTPWAIPGSPTRCATCRSSRCSRRPSAHVTSGTVALVSRTAPGVRNSQRRSFTPPRSTKATAAGPCSSTNAAA